MHTPLDGTDFSRGILKKVSYTHDAMIDEIIANPGISEIELAARFGFSKPWVNRLICSDAFQARLALRKEEIVDPSLTATVEERFRGVVVESLRIVQEKLEATDDPKLAMKVLELNARAQGYGARPTTVQNNTWVVPLPERAISSAAWERDQAARRGITIDQDPEPEAQ